MKEIQLNRLQSDRRMAELEFERLKEDKSFSHPFRAAYLTLQKVFLGDPDEAEGDSGITSTKFMAVISIAAGILALRLCGARNIWIYILLTPMFGAALLWLLAKVMLLGGLLFGSLTVSAEAATGLNAIGIFFCRGVLAEREHHLGGKLVGTKNHLIGALLDKLNQMKGR